MVARSQDQLEETVSLAEDLGASALALPGDVSNPEDVQRITQEVLQQFGRVDLLVNNAGVSGPKGPMWEIDLSRWWNCMEINLRGPLLFMAAVLPGMISRRKGRIVNVSSGAGLAKRPFAAAYSISKTALTSLSENTAAEVKEHRISIFAIGPGLVRTAMTEYARDSEEGRTWTPTIGKGIEQGRDVPPENAAKLIVTLASGKADVLSGCFLRPTDDLDRLIRQAADIAERSLYTLRMQRL